MALRVSPSAPQWRVTSQYGYEQNQALERLRKQKPCPEGHRHVLYQSTNTLRWQVYCLISWRWVDPANPESILVRLQFKDHTNPKGFEVRLDAVTWGMPKELYDEIRTPIAKLENQ